MLNGFVPIVGLVSGTVASLSIYFFYQTQALTDLQSVIKTGQRAIVAGNEFSAAIFMTYRKLVRMLKKHNLMRNDADTFREFSDALRKAIPIDAAAMAEFISVLEIARYSDHAVGSEERERDIRAMQGVLDSISRIPESSQPQKEEDVDPPIIIRKELK